MPEQTYVYLNIFVVLYSVLLLSAFYIKKVLIFEWIISFMHYCIVINLVILAVLLFIPQVFFLSFLMLCVVTVFMILRFINFTAIKPESGNGTKEINILFFNKLYTNTNYTEIEEKIRKTNPDIIGMAEISDTEKNTFLALSKYPYVHIEHSRKNASLGLFSTYPFSLVDIKDSSHLICAKMNINGKVLYVFVFHPDPPISFAPLIRRNKDLENLSKTLGILKKENIIVMGDFNITPWSPTYIQYFSVLKHIKNAAKGWGIHNTLRKGPFHVFIDHIFVSTEIRVDLFNVEHSQGSDHNFILVTIKI